MTYKHNMGGIIPVLAHQHISINGNSGGPFKSQVFALPLDLKSTDKLVVMCCGRFSATPNTDPDAVTLIIAKANDSNANGTVDKNDHTDFSTVWSESVDVAYNNSLPAGAYHWEFTPDDSDYTDWAAAGKLFTIRTSVDSGTVQLQSTSMYIVRSR